MDIERAIQEWAIEYRPPPRNVGTTSSAKEIGGALRTIRDKKLYRQTSDDFYVYCARRWGMRPEVVDGYLSRKTPTAAPRPQISKECGRVYFLLADSLVKIGYTTNLSTRIKSIQNMSPFSMILLGDIEGTVETEKALHKRFRQLREHGEWFRLDGSLKAFIQEVLHE